MNPNGLVAAARITSQESMQMVAELCHLVYQADVH
jgi:hypothetical protein